MKLFSDADAWAVGYYSDGSTYKTLTEHWDGTAWVVVPSPNSEAGDGYLYKVDGAASSDVWAVGIHGPGPSQTMTLHWDGTAWSIVPSENEGTGQNVLTDIAALSDVNAWAVGTWWDAFGVAKTLIQHWDGLTWRIIASPEVGDGANYLGSVSAVSANDIWAAGTYYDELNQSRTLVLHWDGFSWMVVPSPNSGSSSNLAAVAAVSATRAWAVGSSWDGTRTTPLILGWDGTSWTIFPSAVVGTEDSGLAGVTEGGLAVGSYEVSGISRTLMQYWDGEHWAVARTPNQTGGANNPYDIDQLPAGEAWMVGLVSDPVNFYLTMAQHLCPVLVSDTGFSPAMAIVNQGEAAVWTFDGANAESHTVTDASGMGLFDSGESPPDSSFAFRLFAAGTYPVTDSLTGNEGQMTVPLRVSPREGGEGGIFHVTWSAVFAPSGYVFDAQIRRPDSGSFEDWLVDQTGKAASFTPDAGVGVYSFRARIRSTVNGASSNWSPPVSIRVIGA